MHGAQPMPSASPSSGAPIETEVAAHLRLERALREAEEADEDEAEQDHDHAHHARDRVGVLDEEASDRAAEDVDRHEDDGEPGDEQQHSDRAAGRATARSTARRPRRIGRR